MDPITTGLTALASALLEAAMGVVVTERIEEQALRRETQKAQETAKDQTINSAKDAEVARLIIDSLDTSIKPETREAFAAELTKTLLLSDQPNVEVLVNLCDGHLRYQRGVNPVLPEIDRQTMTEVLLSLVENLRLHLLEQPIFKQLYTNSEILRAARQHLSVSEQQLDVQQQQLETQKQILDALKSKNIDSRLDFYVHVNHPPANYVAREELVDKIVGQIISPYVAPIVFHGMGGVGKSTIARAICEDIRIKEFFSDGVLLLRLGQRPNIIEILADLIEHVGGASRPSYSTIPLLKNKLAALLTNKKILLILDNAWNYPDVEVFNVINEGSRIFITTRQGSIAEKIGVSPIPCPEMKPSEGNKLLLNWAELKLSNTSTETIVSIVNNLGHLPLAIDLAGSQLAHFRGTAEEWLSEFEARSSRYSRDIHGKLKNVFELSLQQLSDEDRELFTALAIFEKDESIPEVAISRLWFGLQNISQRDVEFIVHNLESIALVKIDGTQSTPMLRLHGVIHDLILTELDTYSLANIHRVLVSEYRNLLTKGSNWHTLNNDGYIYNHLVYHLCESGAIDEAQNLFSSQDWISRHLEISDFRYHHVIADIESIWQRLRQKAIQETEIGTFESFTSCFRLALIRTSINSVAENFSSVVIDAAIEHGIWTIDAAISIVQRTSDPSRRLEICTALSVERDDLSSDQQLILHRIFFETIQIFSDYSTIVNALQKIGTRLHPEYIDQALLLVKDIVFLFNRMEGLAVLLPLLSYDRQVQLLQEAIEEIAQHTDELDKGRALAAIAPHLTADLIPTAIELITNLRGHYERSSTIAALVNNADEQQIRQLYQIARAIRDGKERARAVTALADYLPYELVDDAIMAVSDVDEIYSRIQAQVKLAPYFDPDRQDSIFRTILEDIRNNNNTFTRCDFALRSSPMGLYEQLPNKYQIEAIKCCYETGLVVNSGWHRAQAFALALFRICQRDDIAEFSDMFERSFYELVHLAVATFGGLSELVAYLPEYQAKVARETILEVMELPVGGEDERQKNQNRKDRAVWVARILPLLSVEDRTKTLDKIFEVAFSLPKQKDVLDVINSVVPHLQKAELQGVIAKLSQIQDKNSRAGALSRIAQHLPKSSRIEILEQVLLEYLPQMLTENEKAFTIARISATLEATQLHHCFALIDEFTAESAKAIALANIARNVTNPPIDQIYNAAISLSDDEAKALIIEALADDIAPQQIDECISFVVSLSNVEQKTKILSSFARRMPKEQVYRCFNEIQSGGNEVIKIVIAASLAPELDLLDRDQFLAKAVDTIWSTEIGRSQFGIIWSITSIAPYLDEQPRDRMLGYALHLFSTMPGNHASYPGGNPKTNIAKKLIPHLSPEMQISTLDEIRTIPRLGGLGGEDSSPLAQVLEETAQTLSEAALPTVLNLLNETEDGWGKTHSLEAIAKNISDSQLDRFLEVAEGVSSGWMRARVFDKLPINLIASERVKASVRKALLEHLLEIKERKREELLWSVDINLFCSPYMEKETLLKLTNHIHEICDTWNWQL